MNNKKLTMIPSLHQFKQNISINGEKIKVAILLTNNCTSDYLYSIKLKLSYFNYFENICWLTYNLDNIESENDMKNVYAVCKKEKIGMLICYSLNNFLQNKDDQSYVRNFFADCDIPVYFIDECILLKENKFILI
ncbi:hypothetical protein RBG61_00605 [Paludicola sp. MB14-C6]|uniref:hypothetical protein n=1 Tax=Paludihabitans sp. MB14-C6 TaxID=3070656 RepID=UPI0027DBA808|nr:hypothetical protein [Paludicola sp. MB14-C6]WMJ23189.1 hypothetical protein RBG61_00605 [Paludicola sp. MB14-C6]